MKPLVVLDADVLGRRRTGDESYVEALLRELRQRIRDVRQGPDGLLYLLTDEKQGAVIRIEPS